MGAASTAPRGCGPNSCPRSRGCGGGSRPRSAPAAAPTLERLRTGCCGRRSLRSGALAPATNTTAAPPHPKRSSRLSSTNSVPRVSAGHHLPTGPPRTLPLRPPTPRRARPPANQGRRDAAILRRPQRWCPRPGPGGHAKLNRRKFALRRAPAWHPWRGVLRRRVSRRCALGRHGRGEVPERLAPPLRPVDALSQLGGVFSEPV